ncbi:hypothetical protein HD806DRAFT_508959 [Xylariaceae sp. AK1471]|nr:hypothetical protein HD806DRAFT_508959 [Xylariaceae sp. AK1471]
MSVVGRKGHTWTGAENRKLEALEQAMIIDGLYLLKDIQYDSQNYPMPRFASTKSQNRTDNINAMITTLQKRNHPDWDDDDDCFQSPLMVGNSNDTERREQSHCTISSLSHSAKTWGLLLSSLKHLGLEAEETFVPVCKAWEVEHINLAEILLTIIAGSLVSIDGLNVHPPGTKSVKNPPDARILEQNNYHVMGVNPWIVENMEYSINSRPEVAELNKQTARLEALPSHEELMEKAHLEEEMRNRVIRRHLELDQALDRKLKELDDVEKHLEALEEEVEEFAFMREICERVKPIAANLARLAKEADKNEGAGKNEGADNREVADSEGADNSEGVDDSEGVDNSEDAEAIS